MDNEAFAYLKHMSVTLAKSNDIDHELSLEMEEMADKSRRLYSAIHDCKSICDQLIKGEGIRHESTFVDGKTIISFLYATQEGNHPSLSMSFNNTLNRLMLDQPSIDQFYIKIALRSDSRIVIPSIAESMYLFPAIISYLENQYRGLAIRPQRRHLKGLQALKTLDKSLCLNHLNLNAVKTVFKESRVVRPMMRLSLHHQNSDQYLFSMMSSY